MLEIICIDCKRPFRIHPQHKNKQKRCLLCQHLEKNKYHAEYMRKRRAKTKV